MSDKQPILDSFFTDAITEVLNIGMGNAASSLSEMTGEEIILNIPSIQLLSRPNAVSILAEKISNDVSGVHQSFKGVFDGEAMLIFPEKQSLELVRAVLQQDDIPLDALTDMEQEAMTEIGNVILNACLCSIADMFSKEIQGEIPLFIKGSLNEIFAIKENQNVEEAIILLLNMNFAIESKKIEGYLTFLMDVDSTLQFKKNIEIMLGL